MPALDPRVHLFGIRHHGPGSARSLLSGLRTLEPDALLIEGPPDANHMLSLALSEHMRPPVALLIYAPEQPTCAGYYPFADYSPEWQAIRYGLAHDIPLAMMDLPQSIQMAMTRALEEEQQQRAEPPAQGEGDAPEDEAAGSSEAPTPGLDTGDPLRMLAEAAGYSESEQWWEHVVEQRRDPNGIFAAILEAMSALREAAGPETHPIAARREAAMRQILRATLAQGYQRVAVVCGAWHAPALTDLSQEAEDSALLKGLPKMNVRSTWVPWTNARLTRASGYGAGIESPGWYGHLWNTGQEDFSARPENAIPGSAAERQNIATRWLIHVARLLRSEDLDISPAHVIEAVRLAETLAALRGRPLPGLSELNEAALTVMCFGNPVPLRLIEEKLIVGDRLGSVPPETPMAPLQQDFERECKRLRLTPEAYERVLDLDLRRDIDLERSHLLHRLRLLGIEWGRPSHATLQSGASGRGGTFHEVWLVRWQPEFSVLLIEAGQWGNTLASAATARVIHEAGQAPDLPALNGLVEDVLLAALTEAIRHLMRALQAQAAVSSDTLHLMEALPPLARVLRYGNVRQTNTEMIAEVVAGLFTRVCIGLPASCTGLNDDAAGELYERLVNVDEAISRLDEETYHQPWLHTLAGLTELSGAHGLIAGRASRILLDAGALPLEEVARRLGLALSTAADPLQAAAWVEGFLRGSGQLLIHDESLLGVIDGWLSGLQEGIFVQLLPLLRRTFASFSAPERRNIGEQVRRGRLSLTPSVSAQTDHPDFDQQRADAVLPLLSQLLGVPLP